ncbi:MAG: Internalin-like protein (LPXTG motif) Lmo0331 homolog, partial [uncultured Aureispira sp.]
MNKITTLLILGLTLCLGASTLNAQNVHIPDANFKAYLVREAGVDTNGDDEIQVSEASAFNGTITCSNKAIEDLTGIEAFVNLRRLYCDANNLSSLDLTQNTSLVTLFCTSNILTSLTLPQGTRLTYLYCASNQLTSLDVTRNTNLIQLVCSSNNLRSLDVSQNTALTHFYCSNNSLTSLDITQNTNLILLRCNNNNLSSLDVSQNTALTSIWCYANQISSLNVSQNTALTVLWCYSNLLTNLNLTQNPSLETLTCSSNQLSSLDLSQNTSLTNVNCASNLLTSLDLTQNSNLTAVRCGSNQLNSLNVKNGHNISLTTFYANNNPNLSCIEVDNVNYSTTNWTNIDVLTFFSASCASGGPVVSIPDANFKRYLLNHTQINTNGDTDIQVSEALAFNGVISCHFKNITDLTGIEAFVNLTQLDCSSNALTRIDLSQNTNLNRVECGSNPQLISLSVRNGNNRNLTYFDARSTPLLTCIEVDNVNYSAGNWRNISPGTLFGTNCTVSTAPVVHIPDPNFKAYLLRYTRINANRDNEIQVSEALSFHGKISCYFENIADLTGIEAFLNLTQIDCSSNALTSIDLSQNPNLTIVECGSNPQLVNLNIKNGNNTSFTYFGARRTPLLTCIEVDDANYSTANWTRIDAGASFSTNCSLIPPVVTIPDANFKAILLADAGINTNGDSEIQVTEATAFTGSISCDSENIADYTGLEAFVNLRYFSANDNPASSLDVTHNPSLLLLYCDNNNLTSLDVTQNTSLTDLECSDNNLTSLDVRQNTDLLTFSANNNQLTSLDVSQNTSLRWFNCLGNSLTNLDVTQNASLEILDCANNQLTSLDVTENTNLLYLSFRTNQLTSIDLSQNVSLGALYAFENQLTSLDLTQNVNLESVYCRENQLTSLNIKNGNNTRITAFGAETNPNLTCIEVDDANYSTTNWTRIDAGASFSTSCVAVVYIPDPNFKAYLLRYTRINANRDNEIQVSEALSFNGKISCYFENITDLTGIEAFLNLTQLDCSSNDLTSIDLSQNTNLTIVECGSNPNLTNLNVKNGNNRNFTFFGARRTPLLTCIEVDNANYSTANWTRIDPVTSFRNHCALVLPVVYIPDANFKAILLANTSINVNGDSEIQVAEALDYSGGIFCSDENIADYTGLEAFVNLETLLANNNPVSSLDVSQNTKLEILFCENNNLTSLDVTQNPSLVSLECGWNNLTSLDVTQNPSLDWLTCSGNDLTSLDVTQNTSLMWLTCSSNNLTSLDLTHNTILAQLACPSNPLTSLNVTQNPNLTRLICHVNQLTAIDLSQNVLLEDLYIFNNQLTTLDLTRNVNLKKVHCRGNQLTSLNIKNGNNTRIVSFGAETNPNLTCIEVDNVNYSTGNWTSIDAGVSFSTNCTTPRLAQHPNAMTGALAEKSAVLNNSGISNQAMPLSVYPNPTRKGITVDFGKTYEEASLQVSNVTGQIVLQ